MTQYIAPSMAEDSDTAQHLDHISGGVTKDRARYAFDASQPTGQPDRGAHKGANMLPAGSSGACEHA